jgi:hypothetical protein
MRAVARDLDRTAVGKAQLNLVLPRQSVKLIEIELAPRRQPRTSR